MPQTPADLARHTCLQMVTPVFPTDKWTFDGPNGEETIALYGETKRLEAIRFRKIVSSAEYEWYL